MRKYAKIVVALMDHTWLLLIIVIGMAEIFRRIGVQATKEEWIGIKVQALHLNLKITPPPPRLFGV